jgi:hypothetical protein
MKKNVGQLDKVIRIGFGVISAIFGLILNFWPLYLLAGALIITAFTGFCGLYTLFGLSTCPRKKA